MHYEHAGDFFLPKVFLPKMVESSLSLLTGSHVLIVYHSGVRMKGDLEAKSPSFALSKKGEKTQKHQNNHHVEMVKLNRTEMWGLKSRGAVPRGEGRGQPGQGQLRLFDF